MGHKTRSTAKTWLIVRKATQIVFLISSLVLLSASASLAWPAALIDLPVRLDPLLLLAQSIASRTLLAGSLVGLITVGLTILFGRVWCGWICPMGTMLDLFSFHSDKRKEKSPPESLRRGKYFLLAAILVAALFGNLSLLIFDPITLWIRTVSEGAWPALNAAVTSLESVLSGIPRFVTFLQGFDQAIRPAVFTAEPIGVRLPWLPVLIFAGIILLNLIAERFWCRYLCPLGGLLGWISRIALFKRTVSGECKGCGLCEGVCPTGTIDPNRDYASDPAECTLCLNCLPSCPRSAIQFLPGKIGSSPQAYDPSRRSLLAAGAVSLAGITLAEADRTRRQTQPFTLRSPGVIESQLLQKCLRCGECMRTCPTGALHPAVGEAGISGIFTPVFIPRLGFCQFSCNACGQVCPVEAIPPLSLEEKQKTVIGWAFIDQNRCIPWADGTSCIVCEEMCPIPKKAIILEEKETVGSRWREKYPQTAEGDPRPLYRMRDLRI